MNIQNNMKYNNYNNSVNFNGLKDKLMNISTNRLFKTKELKNDAVEIKSIVGKMMQKRNINTLLDGNYEFVQKNYSKEGQSFIQRFCKNFPAYVTELSREEHNDILMMYKTSTPQNIDSRLEVLDKFRNNYAKTETKNSEIHSMRVLFDRMDSDKHTEKFVHKALGDDIKIKTIDEFNKIIETIHPQKAEIFHRNISRIVRLTNLDERESALVKQSENPFFVNPRIKQRGTLSNQPYKKLNYLEKIGKFIENKINIRRYNQIAKVNPEITRVRKLATIDVPKLEQVLETKDYSLNNINFVNKLKKSPNAKRLQVQTDVNAIIKQKLGQKTFEKQQGLYNKKATVIKLKLLPDIFESITKTRKSDRINGLKPSVENKDAVKLYEKIQGKNKKLVRYMLKQTDENNNKIFNVKDIIKLVDESETKIALEKKNNPDFKAKDAKNYYDNLYDSMIERYGEIKKTK